MGRCLLVGWTENDFWFSTYRAVFNLIQAQNKRDEVASRERWEQTRQMCDYIIAPHRKRGSQGRSFELPWDGEIAELEAEKIEVLTPEQKKARFAERDERVRKKFQNGQ